MPAFKLPRLQFRLPIVDTSGRPTSTFLDFFNVQFAGRIEAQENTQAATLAALAEVQQQQTEQLILIQDALALAGLALEVADGAAGGATRSGSDTQTLSPVTTTFQPVSQVDLLTVSSGTLTFNGSFISAGSSPTPPAGVVYYFEYRIIEIDNGVDGDTVFTGTFNVRYVSGDYVLADTSSPTMAAFSAARTTTGSISYRAEVRILAAPPVIFDVLFYLFARRAA